MTGQRSWTPPRIRSPSTLITKIHYFPFSEHWSRLRDYATSRETAPHVSCLTYWCACLQFSGNSLFCQLIQPNGSVLIPSLKSASSCISRRALCISSSSVNGANCKGLWGWVGTSPHLPSLGLLTLWGTALFRPALSNWKFSAMR